MKPRRTRWNRERGNVNLHYSILDFASHVSAFSCYSVLTCVGLGLVVVFFSLLLSIFRSKYHGIVILRRVYCGVVHYFVRVPLLLPSQLNGYGGLLFSKENF